MMRTKLTIIACLMASPVWAQVSSLERTYAERVAMRTLDQKCNLFASGPRRALGGFVAQARGAALRAGASADRLYLIAGQAQSVANSKSCTDRAVQDEAARVIAAHRGWRAQMIADYPGPARSWHVDRTGMDVWRAKQEVGSGVRAGFVADSKRLLFAVETPDINASSARLFLRDASRLGSPRIGQGLIAPLRIGTISHTAAARRPADTKPRIGAPSRAGTMLVFPDPTTLAVLNADPRDTFEVEITSRSGQVSTFLVEVGDIVAAFAFAAEF